MGRIIRHMGGNDRWRLTSQTVRATGATHTVGNITYVYDSAKGLWKDSPAGLTQGIDALTT